MSRFVHLNSIQTLVAVGLVVSAVTLLGVRRWPVRGPRLPPGPFSLPLVGNALSIDPEKPWKTYAEWAAHYGDLFMIRVFKQDIIIINSRKIAKELFDRRSSIYSDRPYIATINPFGWSFHFAWMQYGDQWRSRRRIFHQIFRAEAAVAFHPIQMRKARELIVDILRTPHDFFDHIQRFSAAVIMSIVYDYDVAPKHDHFVELFERGSVLAFENITPEASSIVDAFPFRNLPEWFPGAVLRRKAEDSKRCAMRMIAEPFDYARKREAMGSAASAMALELLRDKRNVDNPSRLESVKETCVTAFIAGAETSSTTLRCFMLAMLQYPEVQKRAQAEIDAVVGTDRLPTYEDRPNLPYIEAVFLETLRMYTIVPLGVPHANTVDDVYEDFYIPKGSTLVPNVWAFCHDEHDYPDHDVFKPERFIADGKFNGDKIIDNLVFGFGRRVCPGRYTADSAIWAGMVLLLYAFKITRALDERGQEIEFEPTFTCGVTTAPVLFPCSITPRRPNVDIQKLATVDSFE